MLFAFDAFLFLRRFLYLQGLRRRVERLHEGWQHRAERVFWHSQPRHVAHVATEIHPGGDDGSQGRRHRLHLAKHRLQVSIIDHILKLSKLKVLRIKIVPT